MSKYSKLHADLNAVLKAKNKVLTDEQKDSVEKTLEMLDGLDEKYEQELNEAVEYAMDHANLGAKPEDGSPNDTVKEFTTTLYTTETAESDPAFNEALEKYPDVSEDDMREHINLNKEKDRDYALYDMLPDLKVPHMCTLRTHNYWNGSRMRVLSIENATMSDLFDIGSSSRDYQDFMIYCKNGHLRVDMSHHDATNTCICLRVINTLAYNEFVCAKNAAGIEDAETLARELINRKIAISIVPEIAKAFGVELKDI